MACMLNASVPASSPHQHPRLQGVGAPMSILSSSSRSLSAGRSARSLATNLAGCAPHAAAHRHPLTRTLLILAAPRHTACASRGAQRALSTQQRGARVRRGAVRTSQNCTRGSCRPPVASRCGYSTPGLQHHHHHHSAVRAATQPPPQLWSRDGPVGGAWPCAPVNHEFLASHRIVSTGEYSFMMS